MQKNKGFTLVEMMVVIAIIGIVSAIAIPGFQSITTTKARDAASMIQADFEKARSRAIRENASVEVTIDEDGYSITIDRSGVISSLGNCKMPPGIKISESTFNGGKTGFNGRGYSTNRGTLTLLDSSGKSATLDMKNRFGRITIPDPTPTS